MSTRSMVEAEILRFQGKGGVGVVGEIFRPAPETPAQGSMVLLHGGGQTRHSWRTSGRRFATDGWTALALDARGHGDSDWAPDADYSFDTLIADLQIVLGTFPTPSVLVGASLGGLTSLIAAGEQPDLARALVLVDITPRLEVKGSNRILEFMVSAPHGFGSLQEASDAIHAYNPDRPRPANLDGLRKNVRQHPDGRWYWHWDPKFLGQSDEATSLQHQDRLERAARNVTIPTILVRGSRSDVVSNQGVAEMRELIPHSRVEEAAAGHMIAGDDNDVFAAHVLNFLAELDPSPGH